MSATVLTNAPLGRNASSAPSGRGPTSQLDGWAAEVVKLCDRQAITIDLNLAKPKTKTRKTQHFQTVHRQVPPHQHPHSKDQPHHPLQGPSLNPRVVNAVPAHTEDLGANIASIWDELPPPPVSSIVEVDCTGLPPVQPGPVDPLPQPPFSPTADGSSSSSPSVSFSSSSSDSDSSSVSGIDSGDTSSSSSLTLGGQRKRSVGPSVSVRVPPALLYSAYRCHVPCLGNHLTDETVNLNCAASPLCLAGMAQLQTHTSAVEQCVNVSLGIPPYVYPRLSAQCSMEDVITDVMTARRAWTNAMATKTSRAMEAAAGEEDAKKTPLAMHCLWRGLKNLGNTCYFNSVVQLMFSIGSVRRAILSSAPESSPGEQELRQSGLREVFAQMAFSRDGNNFNGVDPTSFCQFLSLNPSVQQDAQEFFALLVDWLQTKCGTAVKKAVDRAFGGALLYNRRCGACGREAKRAEPFLFLTLPVKQTLQESLETFLKPDEVEGFTCEGCSQTATATSHQYLRSLPDVLVMHLNRFEFDLRTLQRRKVNTNVGLQRELDMAPFMQAWHTSNKETTATAAAPSNGEAPAAAAAVVRADGDHVYELRGVVNHISESAMSGHYVFDGKARRQLPSGEDAKDDMWLRFNDEETTKCSQYSGNTVASKDAYLLIYCRKEKSPAADAATSAAPARSKKGEADAAITTPTENNNIPKKSMPLSSSSAATAPAAENCAAPHTRELPLYIMNYVNRVNEQVLEELQTWKQKKAVVTKAMQKWAAAANAVFSSGGKDNNKNNNNGNGTIATPEVNKNGKRTSATHPPGAPAAAASLKEYFAFPTKWLQSFGRCFLPPFIDVKLCNNVPNPGAAADVYDVETNTFTAGPNGKNAVAAAANNPLADGAESNNVSSTSYASPVGSKGPATGTLLAMSSSSCFRQQRSSLLAESVKKYALQHAVKSLSCPHSRLAPWSEYKLVSADAYQKIDQFLQFVEEMHAPRVQKEDARAAQTSSGTLTAADRLRSLTQRKDCRTFFVDKEGTHMCPACCASEAACILQWSDVFKEDQNMFKLLVDAPGKTGSNADFLAKHGGDEKTTADSPSPPRAGEQAEEPLVYVSEYVAAAWERYVLSLKRWKDLVQREGYTAAYMLRRSRLEPNTTLMAGDTPTDATTEAAVGFLSSHHKASHTFRELAHDSLYGEETTYAAPHGIVCPHGCLKPTAEVRVVPDTLRLYWIQRIPDILSEEAVFETSHYFSAARVVDEAAMSRLLPFFPVEATQPCEECFSAATAATGTASCLPARRLEMVELKKRFPTLAKAGKLTSPETVRRMMVMEDISSVEQYITAHHPNRTFFKNTPAKKNQEVHQAWQEEQDAKIKAQEHTLQQLKQQHEREKNADAHWKAMTRGGRRGGGGNSNSNSNSNNSNNNSGSRHHPSANSQADEKTLHAQVEEATAALAALRLATPPVRTLYTGCVPTWWVAQWYKAAEQDGDGAAGDPLLPELTYDAFLCPHGGCTAELSWLNPADPFWHVERTKRAASLFGGVGQDGSVLPPLGPSSQAELMCQWFPPLIFVPWEEFTDLLRSVGKADLLTAEVEETPTTGTNAAAPAADSSETTTTAAAPAAEQSIPKEGAAAIVYVAEVGGEKKLCPSTCATCVEGGLATYENKIRCFENGSLHLNVHIRKSKKSYHDATSVLLSEEVEGGLHYTTTVAQVRAAIVDHIARHHHLAVVGADLELLRKRKPLQRVSAAAGAAEAATASTAVPSPPSPTAAAGEEKEAEGHVDTTALANAPPPVDGAQSLPSPTSPFPAFSLEEATLQEVGLLDGDTLTANYTERVAPYAAPTAGDVSEEWEAIPPELLDPSATHAAAEHKTAFGDTRFAMNSVLPARAGAAGVGVAAAAVGGGSTTGPGAEEERGVACAVCTFLNAPGMVVCEMCEAPLPTH